MDGINNFSFSEVRMEKNIAKHYKEKDLSYLFCMIHTFLQKLIKSDRITTGYFLSQGKLQPQEKECEVLIFICED